MNRIGVAIVTGAMACFAGSCAPSQQRGSANSSAAAAPLSAGNSGVHEIALPHYQPDLPPGPGRDTYAVACLSCHTSRYVSTQPPLTAAQWEQTVRKMMKTYGAPIAEEQVQPIVNYLAATARSPEGQVLAATTVPRQPPPRITLASAGAQRTRDEDRGEEIYGRLCASCHGTHGAGDGRSAETMLPRPTDLTKTRYTPGAMTTAVWRGVRGTAMPAFTALSPDDLRAVVTYTPALGPAGNEPPGEIATHALDPRRLYEQNCANCHGPDGAADGINAAPVPRPPANFRDVQPTAAFAERVITDGVPGTTMPPWKTKLTDEERKILAEYVRSFYRAR